VVVLCPPPEGVTPAQLTCGTTECVFGWPADAIWARQRPGKAFGLGPFPCLLGTPVRIDELPVLDVVVVGLPELLAG
jgi:hypothetical protein